MTAPEPRSPAGPGVLAALAILALLGACPLFLSDFFVLQIGAQTLFLGTVALSVVFLSRYAGMFSLAQIAIYGASGYTVAILTATYRLPWYSGVLAALLVSSAVAFVFGLVACRTQGIYFFMITLAQAMLLYRFVDQDHVLANGHTGINGVRAPSFGALSLSSPDAFYYTSLAAAAAMYWLVRRVARTPFGLTLQGIRDNPRRMRTLGFNVAAYRVAAFTLAGFVAAVAGVLGVWYNGSISPGTIDMSRTEAIVVIAVSGGLAHLEGAFLGALLFTLVTNFASSYTDRFNTLIGLTFLLVTLFLPEGLAGVLRRAARALARRCARLLRPPQDRPLDRGSRRDRGA
ncbi:branched-chain amino acid ABC transporter permease [Sorangium sp. So ce233]|uniref:branched-chain amino acid ABC transporter permease n=1 Tax=Sorangium sp. So ce233 TaxID=3133290 RepID=UPI003F606C69